MVLDVYTKLFLFDINSKSVLSEGFDSKLTICGKFHYAGVHLFIVVDSIALHCIAGVHLFILADCSFTKVANFSTHIPWPAEWFLSRSQ